MRRGAPSERVCGPIELGASSRRVFSFLFNLPPRELIIPANDDKTGQIRLPGVMPFGQIETRMRASAYSIKAARADREYGNVLDSSDKNNPPSIVRASPVRNRNKKQIQGVCGPSRATFDSLRLFQVLPQVFQQVSRQVLRARRARRKLGHNPAFGIHSGLFYLNNVKRIRSL